MKWSEIDEAGAGLQQKDEDQPVFSVNVETLADEKCDQLNMSFFLKPQSQLNQHSTTNH